MREDLPRDFLVDYLRDPEALLRGNGAEVLKSVAKSTVVRRDAGGRGIVIKYYHPAARLASSRALKSLRAAALLQSAGVNTAAPLAAFYNAGWRGGGYYVSEEITGSQALRAVLQEIQTEFSGIEARGLRRRLLGGAAELFYRLHAARIYHRDLKGGNILVRGWEKPSWELLLVDLDGLSRMRRLWASRRIKNLAQLCRIRRWTQRDRIYFMKNYCGRFGMDNAARKGLTRKVLAASARRPITCGEDQWR
jgi:serine/threonine protein kinase